MKRTVFTLASARSGTLYLRNLFQNNVRGCACRHEPFFDWGNPTMFGRAIYDAYAGRLEAIRARLAQKRAYVESLAGESYLESSHAFLKSAYVAALEFFPSLRLVHLVRDPLKVAASEAYRQQWRERVHAPFHFYTGDDGRRHFLWALTGNEEIFGQLDFPPTLFQWYVVQWIEIENRAMRFLGQHSLWSRCFTLHTPHLNDQQILREMFDFLGFATARPRIVLGGRRNRSLGYAFRAAGELEDEFEQVLARVPSRYLEIFLREPYTRYPWSSRITKSMRAPVGSPSARDARDPGCFDVPHASRPPSASAWC